MAGPNKPLPPGNLTWVQEFVACGKKGCKKCGGTARAHGPYWYFYYAMGDGKTHKGYWGKTKPPPKPSTPKRAPRQAPESSGAAMPFAGQRERDLAYFGLPSDADHKAAKRAYLRKIREVQPDKGAPELAAAKRVNVVWERLRRAKGWK